MAITLLSVFGIHMHAPLHYTVLFPYGEAGWDFNLCLHELEKQRHSHLTLTCYISYCILCNLLS